jgi:hypothetical protein
VRELITARRDTTSKTITLAGNVIRYEWSNPHVYIFIRSTDAGGDTWEVEAGSPTMVERAGWFKDSLRVNDRIVVQVNPFELEDPEYLTEPVTGSVDWVHSPDLTYVGYRCDRALAGRFLANSPTSPLPCSSHDSFTS